MVLRMSKQKEPKDLKRKALDFMLKSLVLGHIGFIVFPLVFSILLAVLVSSFYYVTKKEPVASDSNLEGAKVKDASNCTCDCGCRNGDYSNCKCGGNGTNITPSGVGGSALEFTGSLDKNSLVNQIFFLSKDVTNELGVPLWVLYAFSSVEVSGCMYNEKTIKVNPNGSKQLDACNLQTMNGRQSNHKDGAAGWFQIEGVSIKSESGYVAKDVDKYSQMLLKYGVDVNNYKGMNSSLVEERLLGLTQWYWDCEYYPSALINQSINMKETKEKVENNPWLKDSPEYSAWSPSQRELACYYVLLTLHNNGSESIKTKYSKDRYYFNYLKAVVDVVSNQGEEFANQSFKDVYGNNKKHLSSSRWVVDHTTALTESEKQEIRTTWDANVWGKSGSGSSHKEYWFTRFCAYVTNAIYNTMSTKSPISALNGLSSSGITVKSGWMGFSGSSSTNINVNTGSTGISEDTDEFTLTDSVDFSATGTAGEVRKICTCKEGCSCGCPCSKGSNGDSSENQVGVSALSETVGIPQGVYSDLNGNPLTGEQVYAMFSSQAPSIADKYRSVIGISPKISTHDLWASLTDRFKDKFGDGIGIIHYMQVRDRGKTEVIEPYSLMPYHYKARGSDGFSSDKTFWGASCGFCSISIVASTLLHKYITPPEVVMASYLSPSLNPDSSSQKTVFNGNVLEYRSADAIFDAFRYRGKKLFSVDMGGGLVQSKVDDTLNNGGMVIFVTGSRLWTNGGHYVVIREKLQNGKYLIVDSGNWLYGSKEGKPNRECDFSEFSSSLRGGQVIYVKTTEAYTEYLASYSSNTGISSDNGDGAIDDTNAKFKGKGGSDMLDSGTSPLGKQVLQRDIDGVHSALPPTDITKWAFTAIGCDYVWGGKTTNGFDCSGLTAWVYAQAGVDISGDSRSQAKKGRQVNRNEIKEGDLVFYTRKGTNYINHVVVYVGNGLVVSASGDDKKARYSYLNENRGVKVEKIDYRPVYMVRRIVG